MKKNLADWLSYIEGLHPKSIMMGLDRINVMIARLQLKPDFKIIVVAGTNGKGSTSAMLESIYCQAGYQVGCYTSPHLLRFNERLKINQHEIADEALCVAFSKIENVRTSENLTIELTYFEFTTLAIMWHLTQLPVDVAILEVGLGGRLDAVNAFESDCAIVTNVDLDHQDYLGETRELIGFEKAGIYRTQKPAICGDIDPPKTLLEHAALIGADVKCLNVDFSLREFNQGCVYTAKPQAGHALNYELPLPALVGHYQLNNAACAIAAVESLQKFLAVDQAAIKAGLQKVTLAGRFETANTPEKMPTIIFDVAHNPHAALALSANIKALNAKSSNSTTNTTAVFSMLSDKNIAGVVSALKDNIDVWNIATIEHARGANAAHIHAEIKKVIPNAVVYVFNDVAQAFQAALEQCQTYKANNENAKIMVFGSFFTVARVKQYLLNVLQIKPLSKVFK